MIKLNRGKCLDKKSLEKRIYNSPDNKRVLTQSTFGKCMYCESNMGHITYGDIEHIKPKSIYTSLEFDWENLGIACEICNRTFKRSKDMNFINPYNENPSDYLIFVGAYLKPKQGSEKGEITIDEIGLNRPGLLERRRDKMNSINSIISAYAGKKDEILKKKAFELLKTEGKESNEFSLLTNTLLKLHEIK